MTLFMDDDCDHIIGLSTAPEYEGTLRQSRLTSGAFAHDVRELFAMARSYLKPTARLLPEEDPDMPDDEIIRRYVKPFAYCPECGRAMQPADDADWVVRDPEILGGRPVFAGSRVPVEALFENLEEGLSLAEILDDYPTLPKDAAVAVLEAAKLAVMASARPVDGR